MKKKSVILRIALIMIPGMLLSLSSCRHEAELLPIIPGTNDSICFDSQVLPIIQSNCAKSGCHDGSGEFPLTTYEQILRKVEPGKPNKSSLYKVMNTWQGAPNFMPPSPSQPLSNAQITNIQLWIMEGALHTTCNENDCDSVNVTFTAGVKPIIENNCIGCHSGASPEAGLLLTNYNEVKTAAINNALLDHIQETNWYSLMPPSGKLSVCDIAKINKWISDGLPNN